MMDKRQREREEEVRKAQGDAVYDAHRSGLDPDMVDYERVRDDVLYEGHDRFSASEREVRRLQSSLR